MRFIEVGRLSDSNRPVTLIDCSSGFISPDKGEIISSFLNQHLNCPEILHLKRIRKSLDKLQVLIWPVGKEIDPQVLKKLNEWIPEQERVSVAVPAEIPYSQIEFKSWNVYWPIGYTPPPPPPDIPESEKIRIINIAKGKFMTRNEGKAVVFSLKLNSVMEDEIIAEAIDSREQNVLNHPCFCAIDLACKKINQKKLEFEAVKGSMKRKASEETEALYFCTGLDIICTKEPCTFCAMAILHSRFARVFYFEPNEKSGGLGSKFSFHTNPKFNHKFRVFRLEMDQDDEKITFG
jgi:tRNA(Arg) A34 adenosine deaminase TadA